MDKTIKLAMVKERYSVLENRKGKNEKCPGVLRKLSRSIRNMEKEIEKNAMVETGNEP